MHSKNSSILLQKKTSKPNKNNQKAAKTRRQRGYQWEDTIVKRFNSSENWKAFRLGSPSVGLPDVLAVNTEDSTIYSIEAKSGTSTSLVVPFDQIERCLQWTKTFDIYKKRQVLLAFKFLSKKRIGLRKYENRELREYFKIWDESHDITDCVCTYDGKFFAKVNGQRIECQLKEAKMPFKTKQRHSAKN
ncbi:resolvase [Nitrosopumilus sp.]|uniref:resolvase n=1 Tax=Nitrosopumilus sp. TaxID=2024843 RepID=UPI0026185BC9|nr:resolvase [Nitrosopumilus sp.]